MISRFFKKKKLSKSPPPIDLLQRSHFCVLVNDPHEKLCCPELPIEKLGNCDIKTLSLNIKIWLTVNTNIYRGVDMIMILIYKDTEDVSKYIHRCIRQTERFAKDGIPSITIIEQLNVVLTSGAATDKDGLVGISVDEIDENNFFVFVKKITPKLLSSIRNKFIHSL